MPKLLPGVRDNLMEFWTFMDQCSTHEENLHRLLGISVPEAVEYQMLINEFAEAKYADSPERTSYEWQKQMILFGAWFALYKRKKR